jgi:ATP-dependent helicase/nuclease subunit B
MIVCELWRELHDSLFLPVGFEVAFGEGKQMAAIPVSGKNMDAQLQGFVDRVDLWESDEKSFFRVVDYKTGKKDFDYCDVFNGRGLQMLLYMFALEQEGKSLLNESAVPAGVQYFPARAPLISIDGVLTPEEIEMQRDKMWKRKGLVLSDDEVLRAMEPESAKQRISYKRTKDGAITGDVADRTQFAALKQYVFDLVSKMVEEIASGCIAPNPYTRGTSHNACTFCPYGAVCHSESVEGRRDYKAMSAQEFWEEVYKELKSNG